jgi:hypothetical protein
MKKKEGSAFLAALPRHRYWHLFLVSAAAGCGALLGAQAVGGRLDASICAMVSAAITVGICVSHNRGIVRIIESHGPQWLSGDEVQEAIVAVHALEASNNDLMLTIRSNREYIADLQEELERMQAKARFAPREARLNGDGGGF